MKIMVSALMLLSLTSCGRSLVNGIGKGSGKETEALNCALPVTPKIKLSSEIITAVAKEFQGRPFNKNAFWNVLTRETRTSLNLELKAQTKIPEDMLYKGVVLFFENHLLNPSENYHLRTSTFHAVYEGEGSETAKVKTNCVDQDKVLSAIDTDRLIYSTDLEASLSCSINSDLKNVTLHLFKSHLIIWHANERTVFSRGEIIRSADELDVKIKAMDPDQRSLELKLSKNVDELKARKVALQFYGKTTMISGTGSCRNN